MEILDRDRRLSIDGKIDSVLDDLRARRVVLITEFAPTSERNRLINMLDLYGRMLTIIKQHLLEIA